MGVLEPRTRDAATRSAPAISSACLQFAHPHLMAASDSGEVVAGYCEDSK